jgi:shikimate kinase
MGKVGFTADGSKSIAIQVIRLTPQQSTVAVRATASTVRTMQQRLTLVGYRGSGKSTVGRLVAARLAWPFIDIDHEVEVRLGMSIAAYFKQHGEGPFRDVEQAVLAEVLAQPGTKVVATGGGAVLREANREVLLAHGGLVAFLEVPIPVLQERLRHGGQGRPSLTGASVADEVEAVLALRAPLYRAVASHVQICQGNPSLTAERLAEAMQEYLAKLNPPA